MNLHQPLSVLPGIGPKSAEKFKKLGIETLEDLLLYFPFRYEDFKTRNVLELEDGEKAVISGVVATSRQNRGPADRGYFWEMGQGKRQFDRNEAPGSSGR